MANQFSSYNLKPYVSMYTDPGTVEIAQTLRDRWDKGRAEYDLLRRTAGMAKVGKGDQWIKDEAIGNINTELEDVVRNGNFESAGAAISNSVTNFSTNPKMLAAIQSQQIREEYEKEKRARQMDGKQILFDQVPVMDPETGQPMLDENGQVVMQDRWDTHTSWVEGEDGEMVANVYQPQGEEKLAWDKKQLELVADIANDPVFLKQLGADKSDVWGYLMHGKQIDKDKADMIAEKMAEIYLTTDEGIQQMRYLTQYQVDENGDFITADKAKEIMVEQMKAQASKQIGADLQYMKNDFLMEQLKNKNKNNKTNTSISNVPNSRHHTVTTNHADNPISTVADVIGRNEDGTINFTDFNLNNEPAAIQSRKDYWNEHAQTEWFEFEGEDNDLIPHLFESTQYIDNGDGTYTLNDDAKMRDFDTMVAFTQGTVWPIEKDQRRIFNQYINDFDENKENIKGNMNYFDADGNYNFQRVGEYSKLMEAFEQEMRDNGASETDILQARKANHNKVVAELSKDFEDVIKKHAKDGNYTSIDSKMLKSYMDEYMGYILHNQNDIRHATHNGQALFKNDQEFLEWHANQLEQGEKAAFTAVIGNDNWTNQMLDLYTSGKLTGDNFKSGFWFLHDGEVYNSKQLTGREGFADQVAALVHHSTAGDKACQDNNWSCMNERKTKEAIIQAMQNTDSDTSGLSFIGIIPGGNSAGSFKVRLTVNGETTGQGDDYKGTQFTVDFEMAGTAEMQQNFANSHKMHTAILDGNFEVYTEDNPVFAENYAFAPQGEQWIMKGFYRFNSATKDWEPAFQVVDAKTGEVVKDNNGNNMEDYGEAAMQRLMNKEFQMLQTKGDLGKLIGEISKGTLHNPEN